MDKDDDVHAIGPYIVYNIRYNTLLNLCAIRMLYEAKTQEWVSLRRPICGP